MVGSDVGAEGGALLALEEHLRREEGRIHERHRELRTIRDVLSRLTSATLGAVEPTIEPISDTMAPSVVAQLLTECSELVRSFILTIADGPGLEEGATRTGRERLRRGEPQRAIYPAHLLSSDVGRAWMSSWRQIGEDQRVVPTTETEFAVFGDSAVVALVGWDDPAPGYAVIRDPLVIRLYSAYFDLAWKQALPALADGASRESDPRVVELLELGMKDEAIARTLGVSLRTVRRRVAELMAVNGVDTRFQLGWALGRQRR
jgi:hypothetical protein